MVYTKSNSDACVNNDGTAWRLILMFRIHTLYVKINHESNNDNVYY